MKRYVIGFSFAALALWVLWATGAIMAVLVFLMVGAVPGTQLSVPPSAMFGLLGIGMLATFYWLGRLNLPAQVKELKDAYHQAEKSAAMPATARKKRVSRSRQPHPAKIFIVATALRLAVTARGIRLFFAAAMHAFIVALRKLVAWIKQFIQRAWSWLAKQIRYSVKGTMLSAHKWSSLRRKAFDSGALLLKRCNSALKRVKSLLIRSAR